VSHKIDLINYRRSKAGGMLRDARTLLETGSLSSAVNRIYYALFYEVTALLMTKDMSSSKHSGVRSLFNEHFVKTGLVDTDNGKFLSVMYDFRQKGDYEDFAVFEKERVFDWLSKSEAFLSELERLIDKLIEPSSTNTPNPKTD